MQYMVYAHVTWPSWLDPVNFLLALTNKYHEFLRQFLFTIRLRDLSIFMLSKINLYFYLGLHFYIGEKVSRGEPHNQKIKENYNRWLRSVSLLILFFFFCVKIWITRTFVRFIPLIFVRFHIGSLFHVPLYRVQHLSSLLRNWIKRKCLFIQL